MDVHALTAQFKNKTLPKEQWTHKAHFAVALVYLDHYKTIEQTLPEIRESIKTYNISVGTANTAHAGYHETLTVFWLTVVYEYIVFKNQNDLNLVYADFMETAFAHAEFPWRFYSKELLFSQSARQIWTEPDLLPISEIREIIHTGNR